MRLLRDRRDRDDVRILKIEASAALRAAFVEQGIITKEQADDPTELAAAVGDFLETVLNV